MKRLRIFLLFAGVIAVSPSYAQSTDNTQTTDTQSVTSSGQRPEMPNLFYRQEQRRVLEAVRQGVVKEESFDIQGFVPVVILEEVLQEELEEDLEVRSRDAEIYFDAYIVNHKTGQSVLWVNGQRLQLDKDSDVLLREGILIDESEETDSFSGGVLQGADSYSNSSFKIRVGQVLSTDGFVEETLPIIIKKN